MKHLKKNCVTFGVEITIEGQPEFEARPQHIYQLLGALFC